MTELPRPIAVFDIDGVVADVRHRMHHIARRPKDWDAFFDAAADDPPLQIGIERVFAIRDDHDIVFLTGRPERIRRVTERWLEQHGLGGFRVHMRRGRDFRPARRMKAEELARIAGDGRIVLVLDDDPEVVGELRGLGWPAELATWVPHERTLRQAQEAEGRT